MEQTFVLSQASVMGTGEVSVVTFRQLKSEGFNVTGEPYFDPYAEDDSVECYKNATITFDVLSELQRFVDIVGNIVIYKNGEICIYDTYIE